MATASITCAKCNTDDVDVVRKDEFEVFVLCNECGLTRSTSLGLPLAS